MSEAGTLAGARPGSVLVDMTTSEPALAIEIDRAAGAKQVHAVDAPVSGGDIGAREKLLTLQSELWSLIREEAIDAEREVQHA